MVTFCIQYITDLRDHGIIVDADVTSLLNAAVYTDLEESRVSQETTASGRLCV